MNAGSRTMMNMMMMCMGSMCMRCRADFRMLSR